MQFTNHEKRNASQRHFDAENSSGYHDHRVLQNNLAHKLSYFDN